MEGKWRKLPALVVGRMVELSEEKLRKAESRKGRFSTVRGKSKIMYLRMPYGL